MHDMYILKKIEFVEKLKAYRSKEAKAQPQSAEWRGRRREVLGFTVIANRQPKENDKNSFGLVVGPWAINVI